MVSRGITKRTAGLTIEEALARLVGSNLLEGIAIVGPDGKTPGTCQGRLGPSDARPSGVAARDTRAGDLRTAGRAMVDFSAPEAGTAESGSDYDVLLLAPELPFGVAQVFTEIS